MREVYYITTDPGNQNPHLFRSESEFVINEGESVLLVLTAKDKLQTLKSRPNQSTRTFSSKQLCNIVTNKGKVIKVENNTRLSQLYQMAKINVNIFSAITANLLEYLNAKRK